MTETTSVLDRPLELAAQVSVRPERFGALLYHFGTRRLSFLKDPRLLAVVQRLPEVPTARAACTACGVEPGSLRSFDAALRRLLDTGMLQERPA
ncbi:MAG TPA: mycofactocin biosynthesis chaperone MftB [Acidimicrobiales bacterium]|jgi:putative mycofactocin binding protein MftB|nr:mycofactocin biosynthesis chaperone MftB [Acidimicrobiales bacterium]